MDEITVEQIKAARMLLRWDQIRLAQEAEVGVVTIKRIETGVGRPIATPRIIAKIRSAFERAGVTFFLSEDGLVSVLAPSLNPKSGQN